MIKECLTKEEVFKQIKQDNDWCCERVPGLTKKYKKQLKSKAVPSGRVLGRSRYTTPNGNVVHLFAYKEQEGKYCRVSFVPLYEYEYGVLTRYAFPVYNEHNHLDWVLVFSSHSLDRMRERAGMDIFDIITYMCEKKRVAIALKPYSFNGIPTESIGAFGKGVIITDSHPWGVIAKTYLDRSIEYASQLQDEYDTKVEADEIASRFAKENKEYVEANPWLIKRNPLYIRA